MGETRHTEVLGNALPFRAQRGRARLEALHLTHRRLFGRRVIVCSCIARAHGGPSTRRCVQTLRAPPMLDYGQGRQVDALSLIVCDKGDCRTWLGMVWMMRMPSRGDGVENGSPEG